MTTKVSKNLLDTVYVTADGTEPLVGDLRVTKADPALFLKSTAAGQGSIVLQNSAGFHVGEILGGGNGTTLTLRKNDSIGTLETELTLNTVGNVTVNAIAPIDAADLTRKDYVDDTTVSITGDTMTGNLTIKKSIPALKIETTDTSSGAVNFYNSNSVLYAKLVKDDSATDFYMRSYAVDLAVEGLLGIRGATGAGFCSIQGTSTDSIARKDYVDGKFNTNSSLAEHYIQGGWYLENTASVSGLRTVLTFDTGTVGAFDGIQIIGEVIQNNNNWGSELPDRSKFSLYINFTVAADYALQQDSITSTSTLELWKESASRYHLLVNASALNVDIGVHWNQTDGSSALTTQAPNGGSVLTDTTGWTQVIASPTINKTFVNINGTSTMTGNLVLNNLAGAAGSIQLYSGSSATGYALGIESGTLFYRAGTNHRWYIGTLADNGTSDYMELTATGLTVNGALSATDIDFTAYSENANSIATTGAVTLNASLATYFYNTATTGIITFTFSGAAATGRVTTMTLELFGGGTNAPVWPASVDWPSGTEPSWSTGVDVVTFITRDGGTTWLGMLGGTAFA